MRGTITPQRNKAPWIHLVEDNDDMNRIEEEKFSKWNFKVTRTTGLEDTLAFFEENDPLVVGLDLNLPHAIGGEATIYEDDMMETAKNGLKIVERLRQIPGYRMILAISAFLESSNVIQRLLANNVFYLFRKPLYEDEWRRIQELAFTIESINNYLKRQANAIEDGREFRRFSIPCKDYLKLSTLGKDEIQTFFWVVERERILQFLDERRVDWIVISLESTAF